MGDINVDISYYTGSLTDITEKVEDFKNDLKRLDQLKEHGGIPIQVGSIKVVDALKGIYMVYFKTPVMVDHDRQKKFVKNIYAKGFCTSRDEINHGRCSFSPNSWILEY